MTKRFLSKKKLVFTFKRIVRFCLAFLVLSLISFILFNSFFLGKIFPGISLAGVPVSGKTSKEAQALLETKIRSPEKILLKADNQSFEIKLSSFDASYDLSESVNLAYDFDRGSSLVGNLYKRALSPLRDQNLPLKINFSEEKLKRALSIVAVQVAVDPVIPSLKLVDSQVVIDIGKKGAEVNTKKLEGEIIRKLSYLDAAASEIPIEKIDPSLNPEEAKDFKARAENLIGKNLIINFENESFLLKSDSLFPFVNPKGGFSKEKISSEIDSIAKDVERLPQNPTFVFVPNATDGGKVSEFAPAKDGIKIKGDEFEKKFEDSLSGLETKDNKEVVLEIPVETTPPEIKTSDVNNLGIRELLGRGTSHFAHSIPSRIYNITLAASRINGILVAPGDTFSFNNALGDISKFTGYQEAYIIKGGKTVLGDGGGVCQVSSTLFRAVMNAGLPIVERVAHAYRVGYYEQDSPPGLDATVYSPSPDLKFKNDTTGYILIQATADPKNVSLVFELYGTGDGRIATVSKPKITAEVAPPDDLYQDDPTLPAGRVKQVDFRAWGAKVVFDYTVQKGGQTTYQKTFVSNYRPWQAVYLRGTGPAQ